MRWLVTLLVVLLVLLQYKLWFGEGNVGDAYRLRQEIAAQRLEDARLKDRNAALAAQVEDLKRGTAAIDELARSQLGMIGRGDTFYQYVSPPTTGKTQPPPPAANNTTP
ncbi:cell division protein FtsB [Acidihalobacter ferrooxydans]|uniref:Cell division protein FtsB n=1 Tax=Acidihalobacter ferrooxydans TaxID=1765967 RepID=A0A1P8UHR2_9GAMM|nr:cell division protein FtsB [Acidihalobacter ferrooxydans]APZ43301.1 cell division protein FtsB [Acidihalobacter ferrooxydans]